MIIYVASPLGFSEPGRQFNEQLLIPLLRRYADTVLDPWSEPENKDTLEWTFLAEHNFQSIQESTVVVAVLDGPDIDSGTACEIGYAFAENKTTVGYRSDIGLAGDSADVSINLQVEYCIRARRDTIDRSCQELERFLQKQLCSH